MKEQDYLVVTVEGEFTLLDLKELATDVAKYIERYGCNRILNDMRRARLTEDALDVYNMPKIAKQAGIGPRLKRALVVNDLSSNFHFLETVFINQGHIVQMFGNIDEALQWLLYKENPQQEPGDQTNA